jgi:hypothetical protein
MERIKDLEEEVKRFKRHNHDLSMDIKMLKD